MEAFLVEAKPWALRQSRRRFPHIPADLYEDVYQQACIEMWQRGPQSLDKRSMYAYLAKVLSGTLGRAHKSWVHDHGQLTHEDGEPIAVADSTPEPDSQYDRRHLNALLSELMNRRLLAPEKAVLQLQLGAGLDPDQVRAALDMTPRQYKRRRSEGLEKLRGALDDYLSGRVCEDHAGLLAMAATGDLPASSAEQLHAHLEHCGACRAEIRRLRSTVQARFAFAPWPIAITAPGWLAAKLGGLGGVFGAKAAAGGGMAKLAATAATVAALAGTSAAVVASSSEDVPDDVPVTSSQPVESAPAAGKTAATSQQPTTRERRSGRSEPRGTERRERRAEARARADAGSTSNSTAKEAASAQPAGNAISDATGQVTETVRETTDAVRRAARETTGRLPALPVPTPDLGETIDDVTGAVDDVTGAVDGLLAP